MKTGNPAKQLCFRDQHKKALLRLKILHSLLKEQEILRPLPYLWRVTGLSSDGHVVVEDDHDKVPVAIDEVPEDQGERIGPQNEWQEADIHNAHH